MTRRTATAFWMLLGSHPRLFPLYVRLKDAVTGGDVARRLLFDRDTELVIEGYPRSANTYAVVAFERAQPAPVRMAHHLHAASQILNGVRAGRPVLVLLRDPREAVASLAVRSPDISIAAALRFYARFHRAALPVLEHCFVAPYAAVIGEYDRVIEGLNNRFGTAFAVPPADPPFVAACFRSIDEIDRRTSRRGGSPATVARPSPARAEAKQRILERMAHSPYRALVTEAEQLFRQCRGAGPRPGEGSA